MAEKSSGLPEVLIAGYPATLVDFAHGGVALSMFQVARLEDLVDRHALLSEDLVPEPPYWAHLWIGARALGRALTEAQGLAGRRVLDLGCGLGLPGLVAAARGATVLFVDREPAALAFVRASASRSGLRGVTCAVADFAATPFRATFDVILGAEVIYDPQSYAPLGEFLDRHLERDGVLHLTDAFRADAERFFAELRARGFTGERRAICEWEDGRPQGLFLWEFRRTG
jgi:predicted nicotinamide N-methyase